MKAITSILFLVTITILFGQSKADKQFEKINTLLDKNKIDKADTKLQELLEEFPVYGEGWDLMARIRYYQYEQAKKSGSLLGNITVTTTDKDGNKIENSDEANTLANLLNGAVSGELAYQKYIDVLREGTLKSNTAYNSAVNLRAKTRDVEVDTLVSDEAKEFFNQAEAEFGKRNYNEAAKLYQEALNLEPNYYKASLYLADSYYMSGMYGEASKYFKDCIERFPKLLEPRKYLVDSYANDGFYELALQETIGSTLAYPDLIMFAKMTGIANNLQKSILIKRMPRTVFPNQLNKEQSTPSGIWGDYRSAKNEVAGFCSDDGIIIEENDLTTSKYLEIYSWEKMLKNNSNSPELAIAKSMFEQGYLDCYVLVTNFHDDFYVQYRHFADNNAEKIKKYFNELVIDNN